MNKVMFEVMAIYFGLNHRPSSGMKWKLDEHWKVKLIPNMNELMYS